MGELSEQNRALMERILRGVLGYYPNALAAALDDPGGADLEPEDFNIILDAARSEGPSPGYDGGKSLGERLYEAVIAEDGPGAGWRGLLSRSQARWERIALTFTASLSDASPSSGDE